MLIINFYISEKSYVLYLTRLFNAVCYSSTHSHFLVLISMFAFNKFSRKAREIRQPNLLLPFVRNK